MQFNWAVPVRLHLQVVLLLLPSHLFQLEAVHVSLEGCGCQMNYLYMRRSYFSGVAIYLSVTSVEVRWSYICLWAMASHYHPINYWIWMLICFNFYKKKLFFFLIIYIIVSSDIIWLQICRNTQLYRTSRGSTVTCTG